MRKIVKKDADYSLVLQKLDEISEKNYHESLYLTIVNCLANKKWYSHRKKYFSKEEIVENIKGDRAMPGNDKIFDIGDILRWLLEKGWIEAIVLSDRVSSGYRISKLGNSLIIFLLESQKLIEP